MKVNFKMWLKCALVRAIKTMAQTAVSLITVGNLITEMDWIAIVSISTTSGIASILTSIAGLPEVHEDCECEEEAIGE